MLQEILKKRIKKYGSLTIADFMQEVLANDEYGYYGGKQRQREIIGKEGDFITAPEISQLFGEIIGIWAAASELEKVNSGEFNIVEFGPGKGILMKDFLRATQNVENFHQRANVILFEISQYLQKIQRENLNQHEKVTWVSDFEQIPNRPTIFIGNEFLDALPVRQFTRLQKLWYETKIGYDEQEEKLEFQYYELSEDEQKKLQIQHPNAYDGAVFEVNEQAEQTIEQICGFLQKNSGKALFIDYGYYLPDHHLRKHYNSTLQSVKKHKFNPIFNDLGDADLTCHVDFAALEKIAQKHQMQVKNYTQQQFLKQFGIEFRANRLMNTASEETQNKIKQDLHRLCHEKEMGNLFKVIEISSK